MCRYSAPCPPGSREEDLLAVPSCASWLACGGRERISAVLLCRNRKKRTTKSAPVEISFVHLHPASPGTTLLEAGGECRRARPSARCPPSGRRGSSTTRGGSRCGERGRAFRSLHTRTGQCIVSVGDGDVRALRFSTGAFVEPCQGKLSREAVSAAQRVYCARRKIHACAQDVMQRYFRGSGCVGVPAC